MLRPSGCARCPNPWLEATELGPNDAVAFECRACHSAFINAGSWTALLDGVLANEEVRLDHFRERPPPGAVNLFPLVRCPVCRYEMERARFGANTTLVIDVCNAHGVWLDPTELPALVDVLRHGADAASRVEATREEQFDPMELLLMSELRAAESAYDTSHNLGPLATRNEQSAAMQHYLHAINSARIALDNYRIRKLASRGL